MVHSSTKVVSIILAVVAIALAVIVVDFVVRRYYKKGTEGYAPTQSGCNMSTEEARAHVRKVWGDHGDLTRVFALRYLNNLPGQHEALDDLARNQDDIAHFLDSMSPGIRQKAAHALKKHSMTDLISVLDSIKAGHGADVTSPAVATWMQSGRDVAQVHANALSVNTNHLSDLLRNHDQESLQIWLLHVMGRHREEDSRVDANLERLRTMADYMVSNIQCGLDMMQNSGLIPAQQ